MMKIPLHISGILFNIKDGFMGNEARGSAAHFA